MPTVSKILMNCICLCQVEMHMVYIDLRIDKILPESLKKVYSVARQYTITVVKHLSVITQSNITHMVNMRPLNHVKCSIHVKIRRKFRKMMQKCVFSPKTIYIFDCKGLQHQHLVQRYKYSGNEATKVCRMFHLRQYSRKMSKNA